MILVVPYDSGQEGLRMGAGPLRIAQKLGEPFTSVATTVPFPQEIARTFNLYARVAEAVHECVAAGDFPVVLSGNCGVSNGVAAGLGADDAGILWFDAHGEYMTPDTTTSGFLDGMGLAIMTGRCWKGLASTVPWFKPLPSSRTMLVGSRDYSPGEREQLFNDGVALVEPLHLHETNVARWIDAMHASGASKLIVHVDLDVIDPKYGRANQFAAEGGLSPEDVLRVIEIARGRIGIAALVLASYDPSCDEDGRIADIAVRIINDVAY
jgi:arginase